MGNDADSSSEGGLTTANGAGAAGGSSPSDTASKLIPAQDSVAAEVSNQWTTTFGDFGGSSSLGGGGSDSGSYGEEDPNPWRDEIVRTIFGDVGAIRRDFSCAIERKILLHGRLYVTDRFICFYSNLFGFEKKIKIPYSYISCITKEYTAVFIPNAIAIITARKEYIFRSFWDRDECYEVLRAMHNLFRGVVETGPGAHIEEGNAIGLSGVTTVDRSVEATADTLSAQLPTLPSSRDEDRELEDAPAKLEIDESLADEFATARAESALREEVRRTKSVASREPVPASPPPAPVGMLPSTESAGSIISLGSITSLGALTHELNATTLPITIERFFEHFLADDAPFSLAKFHEFQGDTDVSLTTWAQAMRTERESEHTRELRFVRRLTSPIGPNSTRTTKMQRCRVFGSRGIVVNTIMSMEDIPYRDCFTIEDRWVAEPTAEKERTRVRFEFQVVWTKATIWKRRIESSSKQDLEKFYEAYVRAAHIYLDSLSTKATQLDAEEQAAASLANSVADAAAAAAVSTGVIEATQLTVTSTQGQSAFNIVSLTAFVQSKRSVRFSDTLDGAIDARNEITHRSITTHQIPLLIAVLMLLFVAIVKQHFSLLEHFRVQQQLLAEVAALRPPSGVRFACSDDSHTPLYRPTNCMRARR